MNGSPKIGKDGSIFSLRKKVFAGLGTLCILLVIVAPNASQNSSVEKYDILLRS